METAAEIIKKAKAAYKASSSLPEKILLIDLFGKETFNSDFSEQFKLFCQENNLNYTGFVDQYKNLDNNSLAYEMLKVIIKQVNKGWYPDWENGNEKKWTPFFEYNKEGAGFGFSVTYCNYTATGTDSASRLCFKSETDAEATAIRFTEIYNQFLS